jgi:predicted DNA binding CopG/RHH family protein
MKNLKLDKEEKYILDKFEAGELVEVPNMKEEITRYREIFKQNFKKDTAVSIRLNSDDLKKIKSKAAISGLPYQTLLSTLIHHYVTDKIKLSI